MSNKPARRKGAGAVAEYAHTQLRSRITRQCAERLRERIAQRMLNSAHDE